MDPLEQLNLMVWLAWADEGLFKRQGFTLEAIAPTLPVPLPTQRQLKTAGLKAKTSVSPDLLLRHRAARRWRLLECKTSSFGPHPRSSNASQAAAMLALAPQWLDDVWGEASSSPAQAEVCYALNAGEARQQETLAALQQRLRAAGLTPNPAGAWSITTDETGLRLQSAPQAACDPPPSAQLNLPPEGVYPLLPVDPSVDAHNTAGWEDLQERLRTHLVAWLGKHLPQAVGSPVVLRLEEDLLKPAVLVWDVWQDAGRKMVRARARTFVRKALEPVRGRFTLYQELPQGRGWQLQVARDADAEKVLRALLSAPSRRSKLRPEDLGQLPLFD